MSIVNTKEVTLGLLDRNYSKRPESKKFLSPMMNFGHD